MGAGGEARCLPTRPWWPVTIHSIGAALTVAALLADPLSLSHPTVALDSREHRALDQGRAVVRSVSMPSRHNGVFAAVRVGVDGDRVAWDRGHCGLQTK